MEYIKLLLFISYISCSVNNVSMQGYERLAEVPSFLIHCKETPVYSLLQCAALGRASKDVRFFFNKKDSYCRWNCTFLYTGRTVMTDQWQQYAIKWKTNAALSRPTTSSSVYGSDISVWGAHFATNGAISAIFSEIFASDNEMYPWLKVQLIGSKMITFVRVYNRRDKVGERFHDVAVEVSPDGSGNFVQRGFYKGPGLTDQVIEILCDYPTSGKYVRIRIIEGPSNIINIAEVEIYAV
ncbi:uncharacterized protein LOC111109421 isoform X3 [Crassostrea virginica]